MSQPVVKALTEKAVQTAWAKPGERLELSDPRSPGLCLRITDKGLKTWVIRYRTLDGRQPRLTLGTAGSAKGDLSVVEARERASEVRRMVREGGDPAGAHRLAKQKAKAVVIRTMGDLAESFFTKTEAGTYRATTSVKKPATITNEKRLWNHRLKAKLGKRPVDDVGRTEIRMLLEEIATEAPIQSNRARALIRSMFNFGIHEERLTSNPVTGVKAVGVETPRDRILTDDELRAVWLALEDPAGLTVEEGKKRKPLWIGEPVRIALRLSILTLQRRTEVASMREPELRLDEAVWTIPKERSKNKKSHLVPLSPQAVALIRRALALRNPDDVTDFVFPAPWKKLERHPIEGGALSHALSDVYNATDITAANLHDLRRTGASAMASERLLVPPIVISRILNHTVDGGGGAPVTTRHYAIHEYVKEKRAALEAWAELVGRIVAQKHRRQD